jgi:hypothetical protein
MDGQFLSNFMRSNKKRAKEPSLEDQKDEENFSSKLARLQLQYKEQLEVCSQLSEELKRLFCKHKIASERLCLLGEEISLLVEEHNKKHRQANCAPFSLESKSSDLDSNLLLNGKDRELFGVCPLVIDAKNATESCLSVDLKVAKEISMLQDNEVLSSPEQLKQKNAHSNDKHQSSNVVDSLTNLFDSHSTEDFKEEFRNSKKKNAFNESKKNLQTELSFDSKIQNQHLAFSKDQDISLQRHSNQELVLQKNANQDSLLKKDSFPCPFTVRKTKKVTAFNRKPRFISFFPEETSSDSMVSASYEGMLQFWTCFKSEGPKISHTESLNDKLAMIPEDIHWTNNGSAFGIICLSHAEKDSYLKVFSETHTDKFGQISGFSAIHKANMHSKPVRCISSIPSNNSLKFLTAGEDKTVLCWTFLKENIKSPPEVHHVHSGKHTSVIQCMHYDSFRKFLFTGGADGKLICHAVGHSHHSQSTSEHQHSAERKILIRNRMTNIQPRPTDPNTLLITQSTDNNQFMLYDIRSSSSIGTFGWNEAYNLSQYVTPSWHSAGNYVACGQSSSEKVNIWDIRFVCSKLSCIQECTPLTTSHTNGRILNAIFHPTRSILATCSTADMNVNFIDYSF